MQEDQEVAAIPLVEERVSITKREVESGRLRIHVSVEERQDAVSVQLSHDEVEVERVSINKAVSQLPNVRLEGATTVIPVAVERGIGTEALASPQTQNERTMEVGTRERRGERPQLGQKGLRSSCRS